MAILLRWGELYRARSAHIHAVFHANRPDRQNYRSEEHTSEKSVSLLVLKTNFLLTGACIV